MPYLHEYFKLNMAMVIELPVSSGTLQRPYFSLFMPFISVFGDLFFLKIYPRFSLFFSPSDSALPNGSPFHFVAQGQNGSGNGDFFIPQLEFDWYFILIEF
jgi:hypothetical protein